MDNTREKLIELLQSSPTDIMGNRGIGALADYLIANGVQLRKKQKVKPKKVERKQKEVSQSTLLALAAIGRIAHGQE